MRLRPDRVPTRNIVYAPSSGTRRHWHHRGNGTRNFFPINAPGMGRFQLLNLRVFSYGLELRFWVVIAIIVSLTLTIL